MNSQWELNVEASKFLADMITAGEEPTEITLRVGFLKDDDGNLKHGLLAFETECPEEGASLLVETAPPESDGYYEGRYWLLVSFLRNMAKGDGRFFHQTHPANAVRLINEKLNEVRVR